MPVLTVRLPDKERHIKFLAGRSVREVLDDTDLRVRAGCNGMGACGLCHIRILGGEPGQPSENELTSLGAAQISQKVRLACQVKIDSDLQIEILSPAPPSVWHQLENASGSVCFPRAPRKRADIKLPLGITVDLGTTHISISVVDLCSGQRLAGRRGMNPQADSGSDVVTRLMSAQSGAHAEVLSRKVVTAIGDGLQDISSREGLDLQQVGRVALVGNTAMLALLSGQNYLNLLQPRYWTESIECVPVETASWAATWGINPGATIEIIPPLAGFVGSDLLAGVIATGMTEHGRGTALIDFGTNSEMCLWDGENLWVTSAAGGPAFEGCGISCGMPADPGAIFRVGPSEQPGEFMYETIAGAEPRGLCGSGLVDLLACLVENGTLNEKGQFAQGVPERGFAVLKNGSEIVLTKKDVDIFQRAKAAIGVGLQVLLAKAGIEYDELKKIYVAGAFGQYLDTANAQQIGLLPSMPAQQVETAGNTALSGCEAYLLWADSEAYLNKIRGRSKIMNLSDYSDFDILFLEHLYLRQVAGVRK